MRVYQSSCETMTEIPDASVQTCVTSPPYYGLRDYGTGRWEDGDPFCDHAVVAKDTPVATSTITGGKATVNHVQSGWRGGICGRCGARRVDEQIGLEASVDDYVDRLVIVFEEVRRVLRPDGTLWLNLGDSYARHVATGQQGQSGDRASRNFTGAGMPARMPAGLKPKDLVGVPWRVAFALQASGWWLRDAIVWAKPNAMPSSVTDRCTSSYEMVFMLTRSARYFADMDAVREPLATATLARINQAKWKSGEQAGSERANGGAKTNGPMRAVVNAKGSVRQPQLEDGPDRHNEAGANLRNVWTIATQPSVDAHFAKFPLELASRCIRIGSKPDDIVLDPFMGSGTVAQAAEALGRRWVGYEINPEYHALIAQRTRQQGLFVMT